MNREAITSKDNEKIKALAKLGQKKYRRETGRFVVENLVIIQDALKAGYEFVELYLTEEFEADHTEAVRELTAGSLANRCVTFDDRLNKYCSQLDTPSGIMAVYESITPQLAPGKSAIYLNGISDPGNVGTILRTALAFGFENIVLDKECADLYNPKTVSAAKDAIFKLNIIVDEDGKWLETAGLPIYVSHVHEGTDLAVFRPAPEFCLVLGSESHGVSDQILTLANERIRIGMSGRIESLNVAIAGAILMHALGKKV